MHHLPLYLVAVSVLLVACTPNPSIKPQTNSGYVVVPGWPALPANFLLGNPTGLGLDTSGHLFVFHRAGRTWPLFGGMPTTPIAAASVLMLNVSDGRIVKSWGENLFVMPHGLTVDFNNNVWVTDVGTHQVYKFSHEGQLLQVLGEKGVAGKDATHFDRPTDVAVSRDGSFYVSDGYGNNRVIHFSAAGAYLGEWGKKGAGIGEFSIPHSLDIDANGNVFVADRGNERVQQFDSNGKFIRLWKHEKFGSICAVSCTPGKPGFVAVDDVNSWFHLKHNGSNILRIDAENKLESFGRELMKAGGKTCWYHDVETDQDGNIYVSDILGNTLQKFSPISRDIMRVR